MDGKTFSVDVFMTFLQHCCRGHCCSITSSCPPISVCSFLQLYITGRFLDAVYDGMHWPAEEKVKFRSENVKIVQG